LVGSGFYQAKRTKQPCEIGLRSSGPPNGFHIDALCQTGARHRLFIVGPLSYQCFFCAFAVMRPKSTPVWEMTKQHSLKAWVLPDERNVVVGRHAARPLCPLRIESELVGVEQKKAGVGSRAFFGLLRDAHYSHFDARKRVAGASAQIVNLQIKRQAGFGNEILKHGGITDLGSTFATDINLLFQRPMGGGVDGSSE
jgi:hypothetical protein